jgi:hypothetical protein
MLKSSGEVSKEGAIASDLLDRMQHRAPAVRVDVNQVVSVLERLRVAPLLQFDGDV